MAKHPVPYNHPSLMDYQRLGANGQMVNGGFLRALAQGINHCGAMRRKVLTTLVFGVPGTGLYLDSSAVNQARGAFHTGPSVTQIAIAYGIPRTTAALGGKLPSITVELNGTPTTYVTAAEYATAVGSAFELGHYSVVVDVTADTDYTWELKGDDGIRCCYMEMHELQPTTVDDSKSGLVDPTPYLVGGDITADDIDALVDASNINLKRARKHILSANGVQKSTSSTSYVSVYSAHSIYPWAQLAYMDRRTQLAGATGTMSAVFKAFCVYSGVNTGDVILVAQPSATTLATLSGFNNASGEWKSSTFTFDVATYGTGTYLDVQCRVNTSGALFLAGFDVYSYDA